MPWHTAARSAVSDLSRASGDEAAGDWARPATAIFESSRPITLFDYFRIPYAVSSSLETTRGIARLSVRDTSRSLLWPTSEHLAAGRCRAGSYRVGSIPLFGRVAADAQANSWLGRGGDRWRPLDEVLDDRGRPVATILQRDDGSVFLPFDPDELITNFWFERYLAYTRPPALGRFASLARRGYYRARPFLPRSLQMSVRRSFRRVQSKAPFPRWPVETALHDLYDFLLRLVAGVAEQPIPYVGLWPRRWSWALVLTHDVETQAGYDRIAELLEVELEGGYRSSWYFVPKNRYVVADELVRSLGDQGFEVGVHGFYHDGRDISSLATLRRRLPAIRSYAERWGADGFRSPATLRSTELMPLLGFDYDSSYTDSAPFEPQAGGCCAWAPYMIDDLVELPITLPQDHTLFELLGHRDADLWLEKARFLRERGGMALVLTHPDYVGNEYLLEGYRRLLAEFADDTTAWKVLPREVSGWWRARRASGIENADGVWRVVGPAAAEARVDFFSPPELATIRP